MKSKTLNRNKINGNQMQVETYNILTQILPGMGEMSHYYSSSFLLRFILKIILSMLRIELEKFFCFTSNFKLEQKVTVEQKVFKESLVRTR